MDNKRPLSFCQDERSSTKNISNTGLAAECKRDVAISREFSFDAEPKPNVPRRGRCLFFPYGRYHTFQRCRRFARATPTSPRAMEIYAESPMTKAHKHTDEIESRITMLDTSLDFFMNRYQNSFSGQLHHKLSKIRCFIAKEESPYC